MAMLRPSPFELVRYIPPGGGVSPFQHWLDRLNDRAAQVRIRMRLSRVAEGLFGDSKSVGEGVCELRIDCGPGYRVYYARWGPTVVLLLAGGDKGSQQRDIALAQGRWREFRTRNPA